MKPFFRRSRSCLPNGARCRGRPWQSFIEANFGLQGRLADHSFAKAESWEELVAAHDLWLERHNTQRHFAHEGREDGRRSPSKVLGAVRVVRHHPEDLSRAFFSTMLVRRLDAAGYARVKHWRVYAEEGLARCDVAFWLGDGEMALEYGGRTLWRHDVSLSRGAVRLEAVTNPRLFATPLRSGAAQALRAGGGAGRGRLAEGAQVGRVRRSVPAPESPAAGAVP